MQIDFSENEAQALINMIDVAVRTQGLASARAGITLAEKIREAFAAPASDGFEVAGVEEAE